MQLQAVVKKQAPAAKSSADITLHQTNETMTLMKTYVISYRAPAMLCASRAPQASAASRLDEAPKREQK